MVKLQLFALCITDNITSATFQHFFFINCRYKLHFNRPKPNRQSQCRYKGSVSKVGEITDFIDFIAANEILFRLSPATALEFGVFGPVGWLFYLKCQVCDVWT
jgi:hypothetical protein